MKQLYKDKLIIGLSGKKTTGKTTLANAIKDKVDGVMVISFATPLKEMSQPAIDALGLDMTDPIQKEMGRPILQAVGHAGRSVDKNFWVDKALEAVADNPDKRIFIIDDVRFKNELQVLSMFPNSLSVRLIQNEPTIDEDSSEKDLDNSLDKFDMLFEAKTPTIVERMLKRMKEVGYE